MPRLYLYKISQDVNTNYDTYDSVVVIADSEESARRMVPSYDNTIIDIADKEKAFYIKEVWTNDPTKVQVKLVGLALLDALPGIVLASYNAG